MHGGENEDDDEDERESDLDSVGIADGFGMPPLRKMSSSSLDMFAQRASKTSVRRCERGNVKGGVAGGRARRLARVEMWGVPGLEGE